MFKNWCKWVVYMEGPRLNLFLAINQSVLMWMPQLVISERDIPPTTGINKFKAWLNLILVSGFEIYSNCESPSQLVRIGLQSSLELDSAGPVSSYNLQQLSKFQPSFLLEYVLSLNSLYIGEAVCWSPPATFFSADNAGHGQVQLLSNSEPWAFE